MDDPPVPSTGQIPELGFELTAHVRAGLASQDFDAFLDRLIATVEARGLSFGGGGDRSSRCDGFVTRARRGSATEEDRSALSAFLRADPSIERHEVGPLRDAWHGFD